MNNQKIKAFYFSTEDRKLRYNDNRDIVVGETHSVDGEIEVCENGLHASEKILHALNYAPGPILYLVELSGTMDYDEDKLAARNRKYLAEFDATEVLKEFARKQALINIEKIKPYCSEVDYDLIVKFLETGDESLRSAAAFCAYYAYYASATDSAARAVAAAARAAARSADSAADSAADAAQSAAAIKKEEFKNQQNEMLTQMIKQATGWDI